MRFCLSMRKSFYNILEDLNTRYGSDVGVKKEGTPEEAPFLTNYRTKTTIAIVPELITY